MRRREFIAVLGSAAAWPVVARAQQPAMPVVGWLSPQSAYTIPFLQGLKETGYVEGRTWRSSIEIINPIGRRRLQPISSAAA